jgi:hypothetical protein
VVFTRHYGVATNSSGYTTVIAPGARSAWVFGGTDLSGATPGVPVAVHWNGSSWSRSTLPSGMTGVIGAASAPAGSDIWAVTQAGGNILHWNGTSWTLAHQLTGDGELTGVTAFSTSDVWVFGGPGFGPGLGTWHYDGSSWQQLTDPVAGGISLASAVSPANIWGIGATANGSQAGIVHYDGSSWQQVTASALDGLLFKGILARSAKSIWVTATKQSNGFAGFLLRFNGSSWSKTRLPWAVDPGNLSMDGKGGLWLGAGDSSFRSYMVHRTHTGTMSRTLIGGSQTDLNDPVLIPGTTALWGAGRVGSKAAIWARGTIP